MDNRPVDIQSLDEQLAAIQRSTRTTLPALLPAHEWLRANSRLYYRWHAQPYAEPIHRLTAWGVVALSVVKVAAVIVPLLSSPGGSLAASTWTQTNFSTGAASGSVVADAEDVTLTAPTFLNKREITLDNAAGGTVTNSLIEINLSGANFDFSDTQADGDDVRFYDTDDTTALEYWTESWNAGAQSAKLWVKLPTLAAGATRTIYLHYGNSGATNGSAGPFVTQPSTTNMNLWLDPSTLSQSDEAAVTNWPDRRGGGVEAAQATVGYQPTVQTNELNGKTVIRFDGADDFVSFNSMADIRTVFWVYKYNPGAGANYRPMLGHSSDAYFHGDNGQNIWSGYTSGLITGGTTRLQGEAINGAATQLPSTFKYMSLVTTGNTSADSFARDRSWADRVFSGDLAELIIYNTALSAEQVAEVEGYLNSKYFTTVSIGSELPTASAGSYTSPAYDTEQFSDFTSIAWAGTVPTGTALKFQVRSASTEEALASASWYGPTGTGDYYETSGSAINAVHNGSRWVQYQATLSTDTLGVWPVLDAVTIGYDAASLTVGEATALSSGTYTYNNVTVNGGQTLTLAGGTTLNVLGDLTLDDAGGASKIVCEGSNTSAASGGAGCTITVSGSVTIDANSLIDADGKGYAGGGNSTNGAGPGGGTGTGAFYDAGGGAHGGSGSTQQAANPGGTAYGLSTATAPTDLGSGGGGHSNGTGGAGGGAIRLTATGTVTINGTITADGATGSTSYDGAGGGGSVYLTAGTIAGSGSISANGGSSTGGGGDGGGGRIAIYYGSNSSFGLKSALVADGGTGASGGVPGAGTIAIFGTSGGAGAYDLEVYDRFVYPEDSTITLRNITVGDADATGANLKVGGGSTITLSGTATVTGNSTMTFQGKNTTAQVDSSWVGEGVELTAVNVTIASGSALTADGQGYIGGASGGADGKGPGGGGGSAGYNAAGGGYGGDGADGCGATGGSAYGYSLEPQELGSGGGAQSDAAGGDGGGSIHLTVSGTLTLAGTITANGEDGVDHSSGAGSGGSIYVSADTISGAGTFSADGGVHASNNCAGAGSGGRVVVRYTTGTDYTGAASSTADLGATGSQTNGTNGSIVFMANNSWTVSSDFQIDPDETVSLNSITVNNGATLTVGGGTAITLSGALTLSGNSMLIAQGKNTSAQVSSAWAGEGITITANTVQVDSGSTLDANGQGYIGGTSSSDGKGPGGGVGSASFNAGGAGHGGVGGDGCSATGGASYGTASSPTALGSGGGAQDTNAGGAGGGAVRLSVTNSLTINGTIRANGEDGTGHSAGAGSGGSIYATAATVSGSGTVTANGGTHGSNSCAGRGAGGRIAVIYTTSGTDTLSITAASGSDSATAGIGTVIYTSAPSAQLSTVDQSVVTGRPALAITVDDATSKSLYARIQYVSHSDTDCSDADFSAPTTVSSNSDNGWSSVVFEPSSGAVTATYTPPTSLTSGYYCWRATTRAASGALTDYVAYTTPRSFVVDAGLPAAVVVSTNFSTYYTSPSGIPTSLQGAVADDAVGQGVAANSTTFAITRASDGKYWNGSTWVAEASYLGTTHTETTDNGSSSWSSAVILPSWTEDVYTIRARATDRAGNVLTNGTATGFTYDQTPPDDIADVRDGADEIDDDFTATTSELAANWVETNDATAGLERYEYAVGTTDGGSDVLGWTSNATNVTTTVESLSLAEGEQYYVATRAIDRAGNITSISSSDGIVPDVTPPTAVPAVGEQKTGTSSGFVNSTTTLALTWEAATDAISGIQKYQYALGTSPGATDVVTWTDSTAQVSSVSRASGLVGVANAATTYEQTVTGLNLSNGTTYFASVRAVDNAGNASAPKSSDGVTVDTTAPDAPVITSPAAGATITDSTPVIVGTAEANSAIDVRVNGRTYTTAASSNGAWMVEATDPLTAGVQNDLVVRAIDGAGNASAKTEQKFSYQAIAQGVIIDYPEDKTVVLDPATGTVIPVGQRSASPRIALQVRGVTFSLGDPRVAELFRGDDVTVIVTTPLGKTTTGVRIDIAGVVYELILQDDGTYRRTLTAAEIGDATTAIVTLTYADGTTEQLTMALLIDPFGYVYALDREGREIRIKDAVVRLEAQGEDDWGLWDAGRFGQLNPQQTTQQGEYAFVVPAGTYRLVVTATGYREYQSESLVVLGEPINVNVRLFEQGAIEQFLTGLVGTGREGVVGQLMVQPAAQTANAVAASFVALVTLGLALAPTLVAGASIAPALAIAGTAGAGVGASGAGIGAAGAAGPGAVSPLTSLIFAITSWFRRHRRYGRVYDAATNMPVAGATIRLISEGACGIESGKLIGTQVTNNLGYYHIYAAKGAYRIEVIAPNYAFPSKVALFGYKGEVKSLPSGGLLNPDVPLDGRTKQSADVLANLRSVADRIRNARLLFLILGTIVALAFATLAPSWLSGVVLAVYGMLWLNDLWTVARARRRALVLSGGKPVWLAIVRVYNEAKELVATCSTDNHGQFSVLLAPGAYAIEVMQSGHKLLRKTVQQPTHGDLKVTLRV